jgi:hypothetical protein
VQIQNRSILKFVQIQKSFNIEICSNSKIAQIKKMLKFENCSNLKCSDSKERKMKKSKNKLGRPNIPAVGVRWSVRTDQVGGQNLPKKRPRMNAHFGKKNDNHARGPCQAFKRERHLVRK